MSQFLLAQGVDASLLPRSIKVVPASSDEFLKAIGRQVFGAEAMPEVVTVLVDNEDFDAVFVRAQREMIEGKSYENTALNGVLVALSRAAKRVALWYGGDHADLETANDLQGLTRIVLEALSSPSVEAYAMFIRSSPQKRQPEAGVVRATPHKAKPTGAK